MTHLDIRAVAFDCDGVMFDTTRANTAYYNHILGHFDRPPMNPAQAAFAHVHTVFESIAHLFDGDAAMAEQALAYRGQMAYTPFLELMEIEPELKPLLEWLRPAFGTAVATNRTDTMGRVLRSFGINGLFDVVVCALDVERPKPHPDVLLKVLDHFGFEPNQVMYIGDSGLDEMAARAAGTVFVAYNNPALSADFHIDSLGRVRDILGQNHRPRP